MLYAFFMIHKETGVLLYEKVVIQEIDNENLDIFKNFITALKQLISQMKFDGSKELKSISLGDYHVRLSHISEINSELVMVVDKKNVKTTNKLITQLLEIIIKYEKLFNNSEQTHEVFEKFDQMINKLVVKSKKFIDGS